jgi:cation diffusion facilitator CzcD-associated flavoprotein CzcO
MRNGNSDAPPVEHVDVLIVGAGISGIGAACHLREESPSRSYAILEARDALGGTWDLFRYPGIRSDSDMHTLGFRFKPWEAAKSIADGPAILDYLHETAREHGVEDRIRFRHRVLGASWDSGEARWTVDVLRGAEEDPVRLTCSFLFICSGYYRYDEGYSPQFPGTERFRGEIVHPQHWPEGLDYSGKRVVVIGSGATAVTLVPAMARDAAHVTMLQRSPTYIATVPAEDRLAILARRVLPSKAAYALTRWKNVLMTMFIFNLSRRRPNFVRRLIRRGVVRQVPADLDVDTHFAPRYDPWDQRMCLVPNGDLFKSLREGSASVVTDHIETFTENGLKLRSGEELEADIIITATGLNLLFLGGMDLSVDGRPVEIPQSMTYKSLMLGDVPNMAFCVGYTNASWTLKTDLTAEFVCRLLNHMDEHGHDYCVPSTEGVEAGDVPLIDFSSGYVLRSLDQLPKQGEKPPWRLEMNYARDVIALRRGELEDGAMRFASAGDPRDAVSEEAPAVAAG